MRSGERDNEKEAQGKGDEKRQRLRSTAAVAETQSESGKERETRFLSHTAIPSHELSCSNEAAVIQILADCRCRRRRHSSFARKSCKQ